MTQTHRSAAARRTRATMASSAALLAVAAMLGGCAGGLGAVMRDQTDAQIELGKREDAAARAQYDDQAVYRGLIVKMQEQGLHYASLAHLDAYEQRFGKSPESRLLRADALRETEQDAAAEQAYREMLNTPQAARAYQGLGLLAGRRGDFDASVAAFRAALERDPVNALLANDLAYALMRRGALAESRVPMMTALQLDGSHPRIVSNAAVWMLASGERDKAEALMARAALSAAVRDAIEHEARRLVGPEQTDAVAPPAAAATARTVRTAGAPSRQSLAASR